MTKEEEENLYIEMVAHLERIADALEKLSSCVDDPPGYGPGFVIKGIIEANTYSCTSWD